jgi:transcriptional regulator with XRE-family HTH domain
MNTEMDVAPPRARASHLSAFFERLRLCLDERDFKQADLARELGIGVATVSEWFTRGRVPGGDVVLRLPTVLQVNGHWLLTGEGPMEATSDGDDLYRKGVKDALAHMSRGLGETANHFGIDR